MAKNYYSYADALYTALYHPDVNLDILTRNIEYRAGETIRVIELQAHDANLFLEFELFGKAFMYAISMEDGPGLWESAVYQITTGYQMHQVMMAIMVVLNSVFKAPEM